MDEFSDTFVREDQIITRKVNNILQIIQNTGKAHTYFFFLKDYMSISAVLTRFIVIVKQLQAA